MPSTHTYIDLLSLTDGDLGFNLLQHVCLIVFAFQETGTQGANQIFSFVFAVPIQEVAVARTKSFRVHVEKTSACSASLTSLTGWGLAGFLAGKNRTTE